MYERKLYILKAKHICHDDMMCILNDVKMVKLVITHCVKGAVAMVTCNLL